MRGISQCRLHNSVTTYDDVTMQACHVHVPPIHGKCLQRTTATMMLATAVKQYFFVKRLPTNVPEQMQNTPVKPSRKVTGLCVAALLFLVSIQYRTCGYIISLLSDYVEIDADASVELSWNHFRSDADSTSFWAFHFNQPAYLSLLKVVVSGPA